MKDKFEFLKEQTASIDHSNTTFWNHLWGTYKILKNFHKEDYVCDAGLYHAVYNTESFQANLNISREQVIELIGAESENLVYIFCKTRERFNFLISQDEQVSINGETIVLSHKKKMDLLWIGYANILEQSQRIEMKGLMKRLKIIEQKLDL